MAGDLRIRKLLDRAEGICDSEEIVVRVIRASSSVDWEPPPAKLRQNSTSRRQFWPQKRDGVFFDCLSMIHEDGRSHEQLCEIVCKIFSDAKFLAKVSVKAIADISLTNREPLFFLNIHRDDVDFAGHTNLFHYPNDLDDVGRIANQLCRVYSELGNVVDVVYPELPKCLETTAVVS